VRFSFLSLSLPPFPPLTSARPVSDLLATTTSTFPPPKLSLCHCSLHLRPHPRPSFPSSFSFFHFLSSVHSCFLLSFCR
jgi:hypothetical protein